MPTESCRGAEYSRVLEVWVKRHSRSLKMALDRALSCGERLAGTAGGLGGRGGLLMRLAGSAWGAGALRSSALALCCSAAGCCAPVWSGYTRTGRVDVQLNSTMRLWCPPYCTSPIASSALQHWTASPAREGSR